MSAAEHGSDRQPADAAASPAAASPLAGRKPTRKRVSERRARANHALRMELRALRGTLAQILEAYEVSLGGRINDMLRILEGDQSIELPERFLSTADAQAMLDEVAQLDVRPDKPRLRDLRRIQRLVRRLRRQIAD